MLYFRCPTCKTELANKQLPYEEGLNKISKMDISESEKNKLRMELLDKLEVNNMCCRMRVLTYLKLIDIIKYNR